jgi:hypothetical protein
MKMSYDICILQTASGPEYEEMLRITSISNRAFCDLNQFQYRQYIGIKRGYYPWQSTYNRTAMLLELMREGFNGWILFIDADAYVKDLNFDLRSYISNLDDNIVMVADSGANTAKWDINAGVFLLNLGAEIGRRLVHDWSEREARNVPDRFLKAVVEPWGILPSGDEISNDQTMLHRAIIELNLIENIKVERHLLNYAHGKFIAQIIRDPKKDNKDRIELIARDCSNTVKNSKFFDEKNLTSLANSCGTDKGSTVGNSHNYTRYYSFLFEQFRFEAFNLMEIGLLRGGPEAGGVPDRAVSSVPSIAMWLEYFPFSNVFGVDVSDFKKFQNQRFQFHQLDLSNIQQAMKVKAKLPSMKIIIDDASHASFHQQVAFFAFFPLVESGGYYIIEDCDWQPQNFEQELPKCKLTRDLFWEYMHFRLSDFSTELGESFGSAEVFDQISDVFVHRKESESAAAGIIKFFAIRKR